ncbi:MAG: formate dehydrogenase subunit alpha [Candidatus Geothermincolia bacterium]
MNYKTVMSVCPYCGCGCGLYLEVVDGHLAGTLPSNTHPVSRGSLCIKGWAAHEFVESEDRLRRPLWKRGANLEPTDWDTALYFVADRLKAIKDRYGPDSIGFLSSAKCTNEENYAFMKFARAVVGTNNIDHCARLCHAPTVAGLARAFGSGAMTNSIPDLEEASCLLVTGSNTSENHPMVASRIIGAIENGASLIIIDPRRIHLANYADFFLQPRLGTDVAWINGMIHIIIREGWNDSDFIDRRTEGFEALRDSVAAYTPDRVAEITGIDPELLVSATREYALSANSAILYTMGITEHTTGTDNVLALANLAMVTGQIGKRGSGINPLRGQNNVQGSCDMGALPDVLSGYQKVADTASRKKFEDAWGVELPTGEGLTVVELIDAAARGEIKALYIMGENPMLSDPDINHVREALSNLELLVVQDMFMNPTVEMATVVFPARSYAEKDGTFTSTDRRVQLVRKAIEPIGDSRTDWEIISRLAGIMGAKGMEYGSPIELFEEMAGLTPSYAGITYSRLERESLQWPCTSEDDPGKEFLHAEVFTRGRGAFVPVEWRAPNEVVDEEYPLYLTTGRVHFHYHTGTMTRRSPSLNREMSSASVDVNPEDARAMGVEPRDLVKVSSRRGEVKIRARVTDMVPAGTLFIPFNFQECAANALTNPARDPVSKIPEFKVCAVRMEKVVPRGR